MSVKGKQLNIFVRFGGLNLKKQKGYSKKPTTFHQPPASRGFYAMPKIAQEFFLIGSLNKTQPENFPKYPDIDVENSENEFNFYDKRMDNVYTSIRKEFKVKNTVNIWHHLDVKNYDILDRNGSWVKNNFFSI